MKEALWNECLYLSPLESFKKAGHAEGRAHKRKRGDSCGRVRVRVEMGGEEVETEAGYGWLVVTV